MRTSADAVVGEEAPDWRVTLSERAQVTSRTLGAGVWEWNLLLRTFTWDQRTYELFGLTPREEPLDLSFIFRCVHSSDRIRLAEALHRASSGAEQLDIKFRVEPASGRPRHLHARAERIDSGRGQAARLVGTVHDVTASQALSEALVEERERLQVTLASIGDGVIAADLEGAVTFMNPPAAALTGWTGEAAVGRALSEVLNVGPGFSDGSILDAVDACLTNTDAKRSQHSARLVGRSGAKVDIETIISPVRTALGENLGVVLVLRDVTESQALQRRLRHAASHDALTGLANRARFHERLAKTVAAETPGGPGRHVLFFIDIDRFRAINDEAGYPGGDLFLTSLVGVLHPFVRPQDVLGRLAGDSFGLVLHDLPVENAESLARDMIRKAKDFRLTCQGRTYSAGVSIGIAPIIAGTSAADLLRQADAACRDAKAAGRGRAAVFRPVAGAAARVAFSAADLRSAIDGDRLLLFAQEIAPVKRSAPARRRLALQARMEDSRQVLIDADAFAEGAAHHALDDEVDDWVFRTALSRLGRRLVRHPDIEIAMTVHAGSLENPRLLQTLMDLIDEGALPASVLNFEIAETAALAELPAAERLMTGLKDLGCSVTLSGFGMGAGALICLKHFPVDLVKLDKRFVGDLMTGPVDAAIVQAVNELAHRIGARTIADGVNDHPTLEALAALGVDYVQGLVSGPVQSLDQVLRGLEAAA